MCAIAVEFCSDTRSDAGPGVVQAFWSFLPRTHVFERLRLPNLFQAEVRRRLPGRPLVADPTFLRRAVRPQLGRADIPEEDNQTKNVGGVEGLQIDR